MLPDTIIVHYGEIALKKGNRDFFEKALVNNIKKSLSSVEVVKKYGKILIKLKENSDIDSIKARLLFIPGIVYFSPGLACDLSIESITETALRMLENIDFKTFKVSAKRSNKNFFMKSDDINRVLGEKILANFNDKKVIMNNPDLEVFVEVGAKESHVYTEKIRGIGGLPVGTSGKVVVSLSGGIDSPVASFMAMKRGCKAVFVHIHNSTLDSERVKNKITNLVRILSRFQNDTKLFIIPFEKIQYGIIIKVPSSIRMIVYRRFMMRIINRIALKENAKAVITGDSIGQVASQTLDNINCIQAASNLPVLSPLIGMNKDETIILAKNIGTLDTSIIDTPDCCSFMIADSPETHGKLKDIEEAESKIESIDELVEEAVRNAEIVKFE